MQVDKVIVRTILTTLAAIGVLVLFTIAGLCAFFPSTSMEITYDMGMERSAIHFAERAYKSSKDVYYIAYATEVAIEQDKTGKIISCGEKFINHDDFEEYCADMGENYRQLIYQKVCLAKYERGDKQEALDLAESSLLEGTFPQGNALVAVLLTALNAGDADIVGNIEEKLNSLTIEGDDANYLNQTLKMLEARGK